jgi:hypothetical protein
LYEGRIQQTCNLMCGKVSSNYIAKILGVLDTYINIGVRYLPLLSSYKDLPLCLIISICLSS